MGREVPRTATGGEAVSALTEALAATQAKALAALQKAYVAGAFEDDRMREQLDAIGCTDAVDQGFLIESLDVLRAYGPMPTYNYSEKRAGEKPTDAQRTLIEKLTQGFIAEQVPDLTGVTRAQASEMIDSLKAGTYDASKWTVPF